MVGDCDRDFVEHLIERIGGGKSADAGELAALEDIGGQIDEAGGDGLGNRQHADEERGQREIGQPAAALRRTDVNFPADVAIRLKKGNALGEVVGGQLGVEPVRILSELPVPQAPAGGNDLQPREQAAHAVADEDHLLGLAHQRLQGSEFLAQAHGRVGDGPAGRIVEEHELIAPAELRVGAQVVDHIPPHARVGIQAMDEQHRDAVRVVGL